MAYKTREVDYKGKRQVLPAAYAGRLVKAGEAKYVDTAPPAPPKARVTPPALDTVRTRRVKHGDKERVLPAGYAAKLVKAGEAEYLDPEPEPIKRDPATIRPGVKTRTVLHDGVKRVLPVHLARKLVHERKAVYVEDYYPDAVETAEKVVEAETTDAKPKVTRAKPKPPAKDDED